MIIFDECGEKWLVEKGDPAWDVCKKLLNVGLKGVVLPRAIILQGILPNYRPLHTNPPVEDREAFLRWGQLWDSLRVLDLV